MGNKISNQIYMGLQLLPPDYQGWNGETAVFEQLIKETRPSLVVEVGTWKGQSVLHMADICKKLGILTEFYCVDTWLGATEFWTTLNETDERDLKLINGYPSVYYQFLSNVVHRGHSDSIIPVPNTSVNGCRILKHMGVQPDLIYIDGSHEMEDVMIDMEMYWDILKPNGVMFGDDYFYWQGVTNAVNLFSKTKGVSLRVEDKNTWVLQK